jgi:arylamine N-acetyltransferase
VFCEVNNTSDYSLLIKRKGLRDKAKEIEIWSNIILEYSQLEGDSTANDRLEKITTLNELKNAYTVIKAMLRYLWMQTPWNSDEALKVYNDLDKMGYSIDLTNQSKYIQSLKAADHKSNQLVTLIRMKANELEVNEDEKGNDVSFDDIMALLQAHFTVSDNITVSRYISMKKQIIQRQKANAKYSERKSNY